MLLDATPADDRQLFAFEDDFVTSLRCIPMAVRMKLDRCGIKLSLRQWSGFTREDRQALLDAPCRSSHEVSAYRARLIGLVALRSGEVAKPLTDLPAALWAAAGSTPRLVAAYARSVGVVAPTEGQWSALTELQRFALIKLTREGHDNLNFRPAMREFGLV